MVLQFGIFGIVIMKIVKIFGPRGRGPPIWDFWDSDDEDSKNIWAKGTWSSNGGQTGPLCLFTSKRRTGPVVKMMLMMMLIVRMNKMMIMMIP